MSSKPVTASSKHGLRNLMTTYFVPPLVVPIFLALALAAFTYALK